MKAQKAPSINEMSETDRLETYEMLRASHTLLRMAYGAIALFSNIKTQEEAKEFNSHFNYVFRQIGDTAQTFASAVASPSADKSAN